MKTGLGFYKKLRFVIAYINLARFCLRKAFIGFDVANLFIQRVDKYSLMLILKKYGAKIGENCDIETGQIFHNCNNYSNFFVGKNCHIGKNCFFDLKDTINIGSNVVISMKATIITHIDMNRSWLRKHYPAKKEAVRIASNTYIGANTIVLMGVEIGENSFVAAGSLVNDHVKPFTMVGGAPAKYIKTIDIQ